jgi:hypothetical protein
MLFAGRLGVFDIGGAPAPIRVEGGKLGSLSTLELQEGVAV